VLNLKTMALRLLGPPTGQLCASIAQVAWQFGRGVRDHAVTPGQQQLKTSPTASDLRQGIFRQHRPKADMEQLSASEFASI
jgi:hypothetical protein